MKTKMQKIPLLWHIWTISLPCVMDICSGLNGLIHMYMLLMLCC